MCIILLNGLHLRWTCTYGPGVMNRSTCCAVDFSVRTEVLSFTRLIARNGFEDGDKKIARQVSGEWGVILVALCVYVCACVHLRVCVCIQGRWAYANGVASAQTVRWLVDRYIEKVEFI